MKKEFFISIVVFVCLMAAFILGVIITEDRNMDSLKRQYANNIQIMENNMVIQAPTEKAIRFQRNKVIVWIIRTLWSFIIPGIFLFLRFSCKIRNWALGKTENFIIAIGLYFIAYSIINYIVDFPLDFYSGFIRKHTYGLSNQTFYKWFGDYLKSFLLNTVAGAGIAWFPYMIIKRSPRYWWLYLGLLSIPVLFFITYITPVYIDPIFNKYTRIENSSLEAKIHEQLNQTIIGDCCVFQVNKSVDTKEMNAYMTGVWNTKRIVLWDTTINNLTEKETLAIVAHEMGHYLMGHVWKSIILGGLGTILVFFVINKSALWIISRSDGIFGFKELHDIASLPLLILLLNICIFITSPVSNAYSRYIEKEADRFELELTRDNLSSISSTIKLHENSLILPQVGFIYKMWNYDHPTFRERVDFAESYKPWEENKPVKYERFLRRK